MLEINHKKKRFCISLTEDQAKACRFTYQEYKFNYKLRNRVPTDVQDTIFTRELSGGVYEFPMGWLPIMSAHLKLNKTNQEDFAELTEYYRINSMYSVDVETLYPEQEEDISIILSRRFGVLHGYTGYGKSQIIGKLCENLISNGYTRIICSVPNNPAGEELQLRIQEGFGINCSLNEFKWNECKVAVINALSISKKGSINFSSHNTDITSSEVLIADEVEAVCSDTALKMYGWMEYDRAYGFSATPSDTARSLLMTRGISQSLIDSRKVVNIFGGSLTFRKAGDKTLNVYSIFTDNISVLDDYELHRAQTYLEKYGMLPEWGDLTAMTSRMENTIFMKDSFVESMYHIHREFPNLVVPINRTTVIHYWIDRLLDKYEGIKILFISSEGYKIYNGSKDKIRKVKLKDTKQEITSFDFIFLTCSAYRSLDYPELCNCMLISGRSASTVLQPLGRTSRGKVMNVIHLVPTGNVFLYSSGIATRKKLIKREYSKCKINNLSFNECELRK